MSASPEVCYAFSGAVEVDAQLAALETMLDPGTVECLRGLRIPVGARCWEVGAGGGSIARYLVGHAGPWGHVVATDVDTSRILAYGAEILRHDVRCDPVPVGGPFDLIHARWVLMHLPERRQILAALVDALAPGGWLVVEESAVLSGSPVLTSATGADAELFERFTRAVVQILTEAGADAHWGARDLHQAMTEVNLDAVHSTHRIDSWTGGSPGSRLHSIHTRQLRTPLHAHGFSDEDLEQLRAIVDDPRFAALGYPLVSTCGRKPLEPGLA